MKPKKPAKKLEELSSAPEPPTSQSTGARCILCYETANMAAPPLCQNCQDLLRRAREGHLTDLSSCTTPEACSRAGDELGGRCEACRLSAAEAAGILAAVQRSPPPANTVDSEREVVVVAESAPVDGVSCCAQCTQVYLPVGSLNRYS